MKNNGLITNFKDVSGAPWEADGKIALKFARAEETIAHDQTGIIPPGILTSPDTGLGTTLSAGKGALGVKLSEFPIPEDQIAALYEKGLEMSEGSEHDWVTILQSQWVTNVAKRLQQTFFENTVTEPPTVQVWWNPDQNSKSRIMRAEIIMSGTPNGHPFWEGGSPS